MYDIRYNTLSSLNLIPVSTILPRWIRQRASVPDLGDDDGSPVGAQHDLSMHTGRHDDLVVEISVAPLLLQIAGHLPHRHDAVLRGEDDLQK